MKKIAIIGAGASGLVSAAIAKKYNLQFTLFERSAALGGVWLRVAWPGMKTNISHFTSFFSDFPWPKDTPDFPTTAQMLQYLQDYAAHHQLNEHIRLNTNVSKIERHSTEDAWLITIEQNGQTHQEKYDGVILASGKFTKAHYPAIPGIESIQNKQHSMDYRSPAEYKGQRVLVVGGSISGTAVAEELAEAGVQVTHAIRRERWVLPRYQMTTDGNLVPLDIRKAYDPQVPPLTKDERYQEQSAICQEQQRFSQWKMTEASKPGFVTADTYLQHVANGKIRVVKGNIEQFSNNSAQIKTAQAQEELPFDRVIFCTGFAPEFDYLPQGITLDCTRASMWQDVFPVCESDPSRVANLACVGLYPGLRAAVAPNIQMEAELACRTLSGRFTLPNSHDMKESVNNATVQDQIQYLNTLANLLDMQPKAEDIDADLAAVMQKAPFMLSRFYLHSPETDVAKNMIMEASARRQISR